MISKNYHLHFMGIGGIGMSALATILKQQGYIVSGCDADITQKSCENLIALGCTLCQGHTSAACKDPSINVVVYSTAIPYDHPELVAARARGIATVHRSLILAELTKQKRSICVAGSHGKTTTTSLITHILLSASLDPMFAIGGHLNGLGTNGQAGTGDYFVAEADESDRSFLQLHPALAVVTNIDLEHLDTYKDVNDIRTTFAQFVRRLPWHGMAFVCADCPHVRQMIDELRTAQTAGTHTPMGTIITYGFSPNADYRVVDYTLHPDHSTVTIAHKDTILGTATIALPGKHGIANALAATAVALSLGVPLATIAQALESFSGVEQRFTYRGLYNGALVFDDYGHHPTEIACTIPVARQRAPKKLVVVFQPQRYTRTHKLWDEFVKVFAESSIDQLIITDIYPASEEPIEGVTGEKLAHAIQEKNRHAAVCYVPVDADFAAITSALAATADAGTLILFLGAGKVNKLSKKLAQ